MPQYVIGVDLGASSVKAVVAERSFRSIEIQSYHEIPVEGAARYPLEDLIEQVRKPGASYAFRLAGDRVALRILSLPFSDTKSIEQVIPGEVEAALPFALSDIVYDTHIGARGTDGSRVVVAAARRSDISSFLEQLTDAHVDPRVVPAKRGLAQAGPFQRHEHRYDAHEQGEDPATGDHQSERDRCQHNGRKQPKSQRGAVVSHSTPRTDAPVAGTRRSRAPGGGHRNRASAPAGTPARYRRAATA